MMSAVPGDNNDPVGKAVFMEAAAGAASVEAAAMAQEPEKELEGLRVPNLPPWPTGTTGSKYDHLFCTTLKEERSFTPAVASPQAYFRGDSDLPGAGINMGWQMFVKPIRLELQSHHHDVDEYIFFLGAQLPDLTANFDAEIEIFLGDEYERHVITKPTVLFIPRGMEHNPLHIKRLGKPMLLSALHCAPYFNGVYQTGYMQIPKIPKAE